MGRWVIPLVIGLVGATVTACGAPEDAGSVGTALAIEDSARTRLLAIADQQAAGCSGKAVYVQAARSTRDVATMNTMQAVGRAGDKRPVWVILVTGGQYACPHTGPRGAPASAQQPTSSPSLMPRPTR